MGSTLLSAADLIGASARSLLPDSPASHMLYSGGRGYDRGQVAKTIRPGFRSRNVGGTRVVSGVVTGMNTGGGKLYALAGSKDNGRLGAILNSTSGSTYPRALGPAWSMHVDDAREGIVQAVHRAAERVSNG